MTGMNDCCYIGGEIHGLVAKKSKKEDISGGKHIGKVGRARNWTWGSLFEAEVLSQEEAKNAGDEMGIDESRSTDFYTSREHWRRRIAVLASSPVPVRGEDTDRFWLLLFSVGHIRQHRELRAFSQDMKSLGHSGWFFAFLHSKGCCFSPLFYSFLPSQTRQIPRTAGTPVPPFLTGPIFHKRDSFGTKRWWKEPVFSVPFNFSP